MPYDNDAGSGERMKRRGGEGTAALSMRKVGPDRGNELEGLGIIRGKDRHAKRTNDGGEVREADAKDAEARKRKGADCGGSPVFGEEPVCEVPKRHKSAHSSWQRGAIVTVL